MNLSTKFFSSVTLDTQIQLGITHRWEVVKLVCFFLTRRCSPIETVLICIVCVCVCVCMCICTHYCVFGRKVRSGMYT